MLPRSYIIIVLFYCITCDLVFYSKIILNFVNFYSPDVVFDVVVFHDNLFVYEFKI